MNNTWYQFKVMRGGEEESISLNLPLIKWCNPQRVESRDHPWNDKKWCYIFEYDDNICFTTEEEYNRMMTIVSFSELGD